MYPSSASLAQGNRDDYSSPRNSLLPAVLSTRLGIPISLCTLHMLAGVGAGAWELEEQEDSDEEEEGRQRSAASAAVAEGEEEVLFIDAYHNNIMNQEELR